MRLSLLFYIVTFNVGFLSMAMGDDSAPQGLVARPASPISRSHSVKATDKEISCGQGGGNATVQLTLKPYEWKKVSKHDERRRWRINMHATNPIDLYFVYPGHTVGNPPDEAMLSSAARKKWLNTIEIDEDKFLPWHNEYGTGRRWSFYLLNKNAQSTQVNLSIDTSGTATAEEKKYQPLMFLIIILLTLATLMFTQKFIRWRRRRPLTRPSPSMRRSESGALKTTRSPSKG